MATTESQAQPPTPPRNRAVLVGTGIMALVTAGSLAFAGVQTSDTNAAHSQTAQLSRQIGQLQTEITSVESQARAAQNAAASAKLAGLGICVDYGTGYIGNTLVQDVGSPTVSNGVYSCASGTYVSIVPQTSQFGG